MDHDWRMSLTLLDPRAKDKSFAPELAAALRPHLGSHIALGSGGMCIYLYAETAEAAAEAAQEARKVLGQRVAVAADSPLERWDASAQAWRDPETEQPGQSTAGQPSVVQGNRRGLRKVARAALDVLDNVLPF